MKRLLRIGVASEHCFGPRRRPRLFLQAFTRELFAFHLRACHIASTAISFGENMSARDALIGFALAAIVNRIKVLKTKHPLTCKTYSP